MASSLYDLLADSVFPVLKMSGLQENGCRKYIFPITWVNSKADSSPDITLIEPL